MKRHSIQTRSHTPSRHQRRGGAVIIVVLSLMTTLLFLGLFFFNWSSQEVANAELFADPDVSGLPAIDPDPIFDMAAEQLIVGTREGNKLSALWGGMHSMLAHRIGRIDGDLKPTDTNVGTGQGIRIEYAADASGLPDLVDYGGTSPDLDDPDQFRFVYTDPTTGSQTQRTLEEFVLNYSPLAQPVAATLDGSGNVVYLDAFNQPVDSIPYYRPDVDYTYPDHNSLFLAYDERAPVDPSDPDSPDYRRILIPSFFRPQLFPQYRSNDGSKDFGTIYDIPNHKAQVFRPHKGHLYPNGDERYLTDSTPAKSGDTTRTLKPFPFPAPATDAKMGIFNDASSASNSEDYSLLDVDLDGDGINDSIWMDLDLPMIQFANGAEYVPLVSFKVLDADGLLNVNAHGNMQGLLKLSRNPALDPLSVSNLGMSRSEVNPLWALSAWLTGTETESDLASASRNLIDKFGNAPTTRMELANLEWLMILTGWQPQQVAGQAILGRYGELNLVAMSQTPLPGRTGFDDDGNNGRYGRIFNGFPGFVHPLSPIGTGLHGYNDLTEGNVSYLNDGGAGATRNLGGLASAGTGNPSRWPGYFNFQSLAGSSPYPEDLNLTSLDNALVDDDAETVLERGNSQYGEYDSPFPTSESAFLQMSKQDLENSSLSSRLSSLAAANFVHLPNSERIRHRFTTDSWDRLEFNYAPTITGTVEDTNQFPPPAVRDVFRNELIRLFHTNEEERSQLGSNRYSPRHRLNLNGILSDDNLHVPEDNPARESAHRAFQGGNPVYRPLIPHPDELTGDASILSIPMYHGNAAGFVDGVADTRIHYDKLGTADTFVQEWWARYDRQRLARDIYCLLWTIGFAEDPTALRTSDEEEFKRRTREMAQFAVNVVDAMDRDNIITEFHYTPDLTGGWNNPTETVYGVEHQELAFNEVLFIRQEKENEAEITEWKDDDENSSGVGGHYFSFIELKNAAPWDVPINDGTWRIRRISRDATPTTRFAVTFRRQSAGPATVPEAITAGGEFLISCQSGDHMSGSTPFPSDFRVDYNNDGTFESIVPNIIETDVPTEDTPFEDRLPLCDLDLMYADHQECVETETPISAAYSLLNRQNGPGETHVRLVLERRLRPDPDKAIPEALNPWVEVDRIEAEIRDFVADNVDSLENLISSERRSPFDSGVAFPTELILPDSGNASADPTAGRHSMPFITRAEKGSGERRNANALNPDPLWQPHFDRDFSSVMELLSIPTYGNYVADVGSTWTPGVNDGTTKNVALPGTPPKLVGHRTAWARIMNPAATFPADHPLEDIAADLQHYRNSWYRLLEFVDVKSLNDLRMEQVAAVQRRTPGKINLNTIRDESVLAGLIDDPYHIDPRDYSELTRDRIDSARWWYLEHRRLRDGDDPFLVNAGLNTVFIPGGFRSRPYRSLSYLDAPEIGNPNSADRSIESTILRQRKPDMGNGHRLFEARAEADLGQDTVDYHTKNRILAKIANNSTTRSNVFFVWIGVDLFEAHRNLNGNVQIGAKAEDFPTYRMFCVVDMSRLEEAYNPLTGTFDFRKFIIHRQLLP